MLWSINKKYTDKLSELGIERAEVPGYNWPPSHKCTDNMYEESIKSFNGKTLSIIFYGKTWKVE